VIIEQSKILTIDNQESWSRLYPTKSHKFDNE